MLTFLGWRIDRVLRELRNPDGARVALTDAEFGLLQAFCERPGRVLSRDQLLDLTQGRSAGAFERSIDILVSRLRRKIESDPHRSEHHQDRALGRLPVHAHRGARMSAARVFSLNRIGTQMAILILVSLLTIHGVIIGSFILSRHGDNRGPFDERLPEFVSMLHLVAAAPPAERTRLIGDIARAFPHFDLKPATAMPPANAGTGDDLHVRFIEHRLGAGFRLAILPSAARADDAASAVAVRLPDGTVLTARLPPRHEPPLLGSPLSFTILFVVVSLTLLGAVGRARPARAARGFAKAAEGFNLDGETADLPERGPDGSARSGQSVQPHAQPHQEAGRRPHPPAGGHGP